ncbi:MAG: macrolide transporter permease [Chitinophagaceae bacterium]|nr:macrolide transporter permease [Chitinophagaceae bacterium]
MLQIFFVSALRNIAKHKVFSALNIVGLSIGIALSILIFLFVIDEKSYDRQYTGSDQIYRSYYNISRPEGNEIVATTPPTFPTVLEKFPEVESCTRMLTIKSPVLFELGDKRIYESNGAYVDSNFFSIFDIAFVRGNAGTALNSPTNIIINEELAQRYFGKADALGKTIKFNNEPFSVTGVIKTIAHSHLKLSYVLPVSATGIPAERLNDWGWYGFINYVKLKPGVSPGILEKKFQPYVNASVNKEKGTVFTAHFQPLQKIHLYAADFKYDVSERGNITYVNALLAIGLFILLIASFNFINLSTARSLQRAKEVGIKKTLGADRSHLFMQFMFESLLIIIFSTIVAVSLAFIALPGLNWFAGKDLSVNALFSPRMVAAIIGLIITVALLAGAYPAIALSKFRPADVLKGGHETGQRNRSVPWVRNSLVVVQFALSVLLIICSITVIKQVNYMQSKDLGFNDDQVLLFSMRGKTMRNNANTFKNELSEISSVKGVSVGYGFPGDAFGDGEITVTGTNTKVKSVLLMADAQYIPTLGLNILQGRNFNDKLPTDADNAFIINETAVTAMGLQNAKSAIGKRISWPTWRNQDSLKSGSIVGVVKDFHYKSVHDKIEPVVMMIYPPAASKVAVKLSGDKMESSIQQIRQIWNKFSPDYPLDYVFLDDTFQKMYEAERKLKSLLSVFTGLAVSVACLGLLGLAAYAAQRRRKEISIRKVLGASSMRVAMMLTLELIKLVFISLLIATPIAWRIMSSWLTDFSYRITQDISIFGLAAFIAILVATLTVGTQALKAAMTSPVKNLKQD